MSTQSIKNAPFAAEKQKRGGLKMKKPKDDYAELRAKRKNCKTCYGYGLWAIGDASPMGPMDFSDGCPVKVCPECGAGQRKNTWTTLEGLTIPVKDLTDGHLKNVVKHLDDRIGMLKKGATSIEKMLLKHSENSLKIIEKEVKRRKLK